MPASNSFVRKRPRSGGSSGPRLAETISAIWTVFCVGKLGPSPWREHRACLALASVGAGNAPSQPFRISNAEDGTTVSRKPEPGERRERIELFAQRPHPKGAPEHFRMQ